MRGEDQMIKSPEAPKEEHTFDLEVQTSIPMKEFKFLPLRFARLDLGPQLH